MRIAEADLKARTALEACLNLGKVLVSLPK